jgi:glycosyltransferase involved in cell wall biosynthesis
VIRRLVGIPYSFTAHGSDLHRDQHMLREKVEEAVFVTPISDYNRNMILAECDGQFGDKIVVIHCGVDTQVFEPRRQRTPHERNGGPFALLCIGTLHEVKGQTYLIEACRLLHERGVEFVCHFAGDGPDLADLSEQAVQAGLADRVHFHGRLTREEIAGLLHIADVVVTPSVPTSNGRREGIPVVLMEAMSSGVPVVGSRISGIPELVEDGRSGLLVSPGDAHALANALERMHSDADLRQSFGQAGRDKVLSEFDLHKNAASLAQHFGLNDKQ